MRQEIYLIEGMHCAACSASPFRKDADDVAYPFIIWYLGIYEAGSLLHCWSYSDLILFIRIRLGTKFFCLAN